MYGGKRWKAISSFQCKQNGFQVVQYRGFFPGHFLSMQETTACCAGFETLHACPAGSTGNITDISVVEQIDHWETSLKIPQ